MPEHEYTYEIVVSGDQVMGQVWWDDQKEEIDGDALVLSFLKDKSYQGITYQDGVKFLTHLGRMLKNGYIYAKRVEN